jgi:hypothetical protein
MSYVKKYWSWEKHGERLLNCIKELVNEKSNYKK